MPSFSKLSKLSKLSTKAKSLFARSPPIVLISEPTGLVVNSVRHLPNGDLSLFSCLLAFAFAFAFATSSSLPLPLLMALSSLLPLQPILPEWNRESLLEYGRAHAHEEDASTGTTGLSRSSWSTRAPTYLLPTHLVPTHLLTIHLLATSAHP
jgi:hypothetical protein